MSENKQLFNRDGYVPDPSDYEVREIRDLIDLDQEDFAHPDELDFDPVESLNMDYEYECEALVDDLSGTKSDYDYDCEFSEEQLKTLDTKYAYQASIKDKEGESVPRDPLIGWVPKSDTLEDVLFEAGHILGAKNDLGKYYRLLVDNRFAQGVWLGRLENAVSTSDLHVLEDVRSEMSLLRPNVYQEEFKKMMGSLFTVVNDNDYDRPKGLK